MHLVQDALLAVRNHQLEQANFNAIPISHLGVALAQINGAKEASCGWFNPFPRLLDSDKEFERTKRIFWELNREQLIPSWVISLVDLDSFKG
jgi:hypothetical protein